MTPEITKLKIKTEFVDAKKWEGRSITISMKSIYEYLITMNVFKTVVNVSNQLQTEEKVNEGINIPNLGTFCMRQDS